MYYIKFKSISVEVIFVFHSYFSVPVRVEKRGEEERKMVARTPRVAVGGPHHPFP